MTYRIKPSKPLTEEIRRIASDELLRAADSFDSGGAGTHEDIHNARKRLKKLRALYRLIRRDAPDFYGAENARLRDAARSLSGMRDATAMIEAVDKLKSHLDGAAKPEALDRLRVNLVARRDRLAGGEVDLEARTAAAAAACRAGAAALESLNLSETRRDAAKTVASGWAKTYGRARQARSACRDSATAADFHELRKRVKYHWLHIRLLQDLWPSSMRLRRNEAKALSDLIGDEHDLSVLIDLLQSESRLAGPRAERELLQRLITDRQAALRTEAVDRTGVLFREPRTLSRDRIALMWKDASG